MNSQDIIKQGKINSARLQMALERNTFLRDRDTACKLTHPHSLQNWSLTVPLETSLKLLKLRSEAWKRQLNSENNDFNV